MECAIINFDIYKLRKLMESRVYENFPNFSSVGLRDGVVYFYSPQGFSQAQLHESTLKTLLGPKKYNTFYLKLLNGDYNVR